MIKRALGIIYILFGLWGFYCAYLTMVGDGRTLRYLLTPSYRIIIFSAAPAILMPAMTLAGGIGVFLEKKWGKYIFILASAAMMYSCFDEIKYFLRKTLEYRIVSKISYTQLNGDLYMEAKIPLIPEAQTKDARLQIDYPESIEKMLKRFPSEKFLQLSLVFFFLHLLAVIGVVFGNRELNSGDASGEIK